MRFVITIDGPSGSGKSTLAQMLAQKLGWSHLNSGLLYRAAAFLAVNNKIPLTDGPAVAALVSRSDILLRKGHDGKGKVLINGEVGGDELRTPEISEATSIIGALPEVRAALKKAQRGALPNSNLVAEGRDMGTVIFSDAELKFYINVDENVRIDRRVKQLQTEAEKAGRRLTPEALKSLKEKMKIEVLDRDRRDQEREVAPLKPAPDAVIVDNTAQTLTETLETLYSHAQQRGLVQGKETDK